MLRKHEKYCKPYEDPLERPDYTEADVQALRAVWNGTGTADQQRRSLDWMISAFGTYDTSYRPGGDHSLTDFAEGRRHAGNILVWMLKYAPARTDKDKIAVRLFGEHQNADEQAQ